MMDREEIRIERSKFEVGMPAAAVDAGVLPWGYGENRITAMVRDPSSAYLYWEITDEGIASARSRLGAGGAGGWCNLRVYDSTGRDFDGTNANDYFDIRVARDDREHYLLVGRPASSMHAEIGIKTAEGFFQPVARSGRVDFPRSTPSPNTGLEWMAVTSDRAPPCVAPCRSRYAGPDAALPPRQGAGYVDAWRAGYAPRHDRPVASGTGASSPPSRADAGVGVVPVERWWKADDWRVDWGPPPRFLRWDHLDPKRIAVELLGADPERVELAGGELVVFGPWQMTIHDAGAATGRRVLATWSVRVVRASAPAMERWGRTAYEHGESPWDRQHPTAGAPQRTPKPPGGASERLRFGASERLWLGASEWAGGGASERTWQSASEALAGAAARLAAVGASLHVGASERLAAAPDATRGDRPRGTESWAIRPGAR